MARWSLLPEPKRVQVEQGIARGWSTERIAATVGCTRVQVEKVRLRMDEIDQSPDGQYKRRAVYPVRVAS